jgi:hypothetical protein
MDSVLKYTLRAELHVRKESEKQESFLFKREFRLKHIGSTDRKSPVYNSEHSSQRSAYIYEMEVLNRDFILSDKLEKSTDFIRRVNYMYDWMLLKINLQGKIISVINEIEIKEKWNRIKKSLLADYAGEIVETYLEDLDTRVNDLGILHSDVCRYFNWGLIFTSIPYKHRNDWQGQRIIEFSEFENEKFEEQIIFRIEENKMRKYDISINPLKESEMKIEQYHGNIIIPDNDIFPVSALIEVVFRNDDIASQWYFKLERIE